jgi:hypothetical protein
MGEKSEEIRGLTKTKVTSSFEMAFIGLCEGYSLVEPVIEWFSWSQLAVSIGGASTATSRNLLKSIRKPGQYTENEFITAYLERYAHFRVSNGETVLIVKRSL